MIADIGFYFKLLSRRFPAMVALFLIASTVGLVTAERLPNVYSTTATLLVEGSQIPDELVRATVDIDPTEQLDVIQKRLLTRANLIDVARELRLFADRPDMSPDQIVNAMRASTNVRNTSGRNRATVMTISFRGPDPQKVAAVVNQFVTIVLTTNAQIREGRTSGTLVFFQEEVAKLEEDLNIQAQKIVVFKNQNADALPENLTYRQGRQSLLQERLSRAERDLETFQSQRENIQRIYASTGALRTPDNIPLTPEQAELRRMEAELRLALGVYSEDNPKVKLLRSRIEVLTDQIAGVPVGQDSIREEVSALDISLVELDGQIASLKQEIVDVSSELEQLQDSVDRTPANRIALEAMEREHENIRNLYSSAVQRLAQARMGERIELSSRGERITVLETASVPTSPSGPNRSKIAGLGVIAGLGLAGGLFVLLEILNTSIRRPGDIVNSLKITPLATIPRFEVVGDRRRRRVIQIVLFLIVLIVVPASMWAIDTYYMPLDELVRKVIARLT